MRDHPDWLLGRVVERVMTGVFAPSIAVFLVATGTASCRESPRPYDPISWSRVNDDASEDVVVFVDTTALKFYPRMRGSEWRSLLGRGRRGEVKIVLSDVVLQESARHHRADSDNALLKLRRAVESGEASWVLG